MALSGFLVPFATGALTKAQDIRDEQDEISGAMIDESSTHWRAKFDTERERIKKKKELYSEIEIGWGKPIAEIMGHLGFLDDGDTEKAYKWLKEIGPEKLESFKNLKPEDYKYVFLDNADQITKSIESKENVLAKNSTREGLKHMSDLYFGDTIRKEGGKLDTARQFLFGGPILGEKDIEASRLQLAKEIRAEEPTLEEPSEALLEAFGDLPGGPIMLAGTETDKLSDAQFRLRQNDAVAAVLSGLGLSGKFNQDPGTGSINIVQFTEADNSMYNLTNELVSKIFDMPGFNTNQYRQVGTNVAMAIQKQVTETKNSYKNFIDLQESAGITGGPFIMDKEGRRKINEASYQAFTLYNMPLLATYAKGSMAVRNLIEFKFSAVDKVTYKEFFARFLEEMYEEDRPEE